MPAGQLNKKIWKNRVLFWYYWRKESDPELDPDLLARGIDRGIRVRIRISTNMSRIPNTAFNYNLLISYWSPLRDGRAGHYLADNGELSPVCRGDKAGIPHKHAQQGAQHLQIR